MGDVITFRTRGKAAPRRGEPSTGDAQILLFLGVRYMRAEESQALSNLSPDHGDPPRGGKKRKRRV